MKEVSEGAPRPTARGRPVKPPRVLGVKLRVTLPSTVWSRPFSVKHPNLRIELIDRMEVGSGLTLVEVQIHGERATDWGVEIRTLPNVEEVEVISTGGETGLYRIIYKGDPFIPTLRELKLLRRFPIHIQAGVATWVVVGPEPKVRRLLTHLHSNSIGVEVVSVGRGPPSHGPFSLTSRQHQILRRAMLEGYFEVPRRVSLTELAPKIGIAASTLSVTLAVIEKKILKHYA